MGENKKYKQKLCETTTKFSTMLPIVGGVT